MLRLPLSVKPTRGSALAVAGVLLAVPVVLGTVAFVSAGWFPGSPVAVGAGWTFYLMLAVITDVRGMATLGVGAAIAAIVWTLTRQPEQGAGTRRR